MARLDIFIFGATVLVFAALVESLITASLAQRERNQAVERLDRWSRVGAPTLLLALLTYAFLV